MFSNLGVTLSRFLAFIAIAVFFSSFAAAETSPKFSSSDSFLSSASSTPWLYPFKSAIELLQSDQADIADRAYDSIYYALSKDLNLIEDVLFQAENIPLEYVFYGESDRTGYSSVPPVPSSISAVLLYLIDAAVLGAIQPYDTASIEGSNSEEQAVQSAIQVYRDWWIEQQKLIVNRTLSVSELALAGGTLRWRGSMRRGRRKSILRIWFSATPSDPLCKPRYVDTDGDGLREYYSMKLWPSEPDDPFPYNCLAYALCQNDLWIWPSPRSPNDTSGLEEIMDHHGAEKQNSCSDTCPRKEDGSERSKIMAAYNVPDGESKSDVNLTHFLKHKVGDRYWSSKNGEGPLYTRIERPQSYTRRGYPPKEGETQEYECYCL